MPRAHVWAVNTLFTHMRHLGDICKTTQNVRAIVPVIVRRHSRHITVCAVRRIYD
jgi:hypothetical protein